MLYKKPIITTETPELLPEEFNKFLCYKPSTFEFLEYVGGVWVVTAKLLSIENGNVDIPGTCEASKGEFSTLEVNSATGIDAEVQFGAKTLKFKGGVLYEIEG